MAVPWVLLGWHEGNTVTAKARHGNIYSQPSRAGTRVYVPIRLARVRPYAVLPRFPHHRLPSFLLLLAASSSSSSLLHPLLLLCCLSSSTVWLSFVLLFDLTFCHSARPGSSLSLFYFTLILRLLLVLVLSILSFCSIPDALVSLWKRAILKSFHICQRRGRINNQEPEYHPDLSTLTICNSRKHHFHPFRPPVSLFQLGFCHIEEVLSVLALFTFLEARLQLLSSWYTGMRTGVMALTWKSAGLTRVMEVLMWCTLQHQQPSTAMSLDL